MSFFFFFFLTPSYGSLITKNAKRLCQKANYPRVDAAPVGAECLTRGDVYYLANTSNANLYYKKQSHLPAGFGAF